MPFTLDSASNSTTGDTSRTTEYYEELKRVQSVNVDTTVGKSIKAKYYNFQFSIYRMYTVTQADSSTTISYDDSNNKWWPISVTDLGEYVSLDTLRETVKKYATRDAVEDMVHNVSIYFASRVPHGSLAPAGLILTLSIYDIPGVSDIMQAGSVLAPSLTSKLNNILYSKTAFLIRNTLAVVLLHAPKLFNNIKQYVNSLTSGVSSFSAIQGMIKSLMSSGLTALTAVADIVDWWKWYLKPLSLELTTHLDIPTTFSIMDMVDEYTTMMILRSDDYKNLIGKTADNIPYLTKDKLDEDPIVSIDIDSEFALVSDAPLVYEKIKNVHIGSFNAAPFYDSLWLININDVPAAFYDTSRPAYHYLSTIITQKFSHGNIISKVRNEFLRYAATKSTNPKALWTRLFKRHLFFLARQVNGLPEFSVQSQTIDGPTRKFSLPSKDGTFAQGGKQLTVQLFALQSANELIAWQQGTQNLDKNADFLDIFKAFVGTKDIELDSPLHYSLSGKYRDYTRTSNLIEWDKIKKWYMFSTYELFYLMRQCVSTVDGIVFYPYDYLIDNIEVALLTPKKNVELVFKFYDLYVSNLKIINDNLSYTVESGLLQIQVTFTYNYVEVLSGFKSRFES